MRIFFTLLLLFSISYSYDITKTYKETPIVKAIDELHQLQFQAFDQDFLDNEEQMQKLLDKNSKLLSNILVNIKNNPYTDSFIIEDAFKKRVNFLKSRMILNQKRNNHYAYERDSIDLARLQEFKHFNTYVLGISKKVQEYASQKEIREYALKLLKNHEDKKRDKFAKLYEKISNDNNPVANSIKTNYRDYISLYESYKNLINFTITHPQLLSQKTIFTLVNYADIIRSVNASTYAQQLNSSISFLYLNSGKLIALLVISILLAIGLYLIRWILQFKIFNFRHYENKKLLRPVRLLLAVTALDYFILMLMYPLSPQSGIDSFILFLYISTSAYLSMEILAYIAIGYFETHESSKNQRALISLSIDLIKTLIAISALVIYLNKMGVGLQTVLTTVGIFGLGIALAAKDSIANFFGSLNILLDNTFSQGDFVTIGDIEGEIVKVGLRSTQIRALNNSLIILPNAEASIKPIVNWSKRRLGKEIKTNIFISYQTPPQKIRDLIEEIRYMISQHPDLVQNDDIEQYEKESKEEIFVSKRNLLGLKKDRFVYLDKFDNSHLSILVQTFSKTINTEEWYAVKEDILYNILTILNKQEIEFSLPKQDLTFNKKPSL